MAKKLNESELIAITDRLRMETITVKIPRATKLLITKMAEMSGLTKSRIINIIFEDVGLQPEFFKPTKDGELVSLIAGLDEMP